MTMQTDSTTKHHQPLLHDHVDGRLVTDESVVDRNDIVQLDPDHPGFRDQEYRRRRNQIAQIAMKYHPGDPIPDAPYTAEEHQVWSGFWQALKPAHRLHASAGYNACLEKLEFPPDRIP